MSEDNTAWYILYTMPRMEKKLAKMLSSRHFEYYLPILTQKKRWSDRFKFIDTPIFPSYIFINTDINSYRNEILSLPGAHHFLALDNKFLTVDKKSLDLVKKFIEEYPETLKIRKENTLVRGAKVKIKHGHFKGYEGIIMILKSKTRLCVRLPVGNVSIEVNIDELGLEEMNV